MENSKIEWTDHTWNPWIGCTRVSPGCQHCYAETLMDKRYGKVQWGPQGKRVRTSAAYWKQPLKWNRQAAVEGIRRRVFCASLADVFEDKPDQAYDLANWREELWQLVLATPWLDWLVLTKRPQNVRPMVPFAMPGNPYSVLPWPSNLWIGTSVENQEYADRRIPELLKIPAVVRFLSIEPLLGPVDLAEYLTPQWWEEEVPAPKGCIGCPATFYAARLRGIAHWVIIGGESGHGARPMRLEWARAIVRQCREAGVPVFVKQLGAKPIGEWGQADRRPFFAKHWRLNDHKGGDWSEWPEDLRVREFPEPD